MFLFMFFHLIALKFALVFHKMLCVLGIGWLATSISSLDR